MNKTFFIADTHFGHANVIRYSGRPFANIQEHDAALITNWNKVVGEYDRVFMLGDFALTGKDRIIEIGQQLKGKKVLVTGNHDGGSLDTYYTAGFEMISKWSLVFQDSFILSHIPVMGTGGFTNIHGHVHEKQGILQIMPEYYCVSVENINYTPIELKKLLAEIEQKKKLLS